MRRIESLECSEEFNQRNFTPVAYTDQKGEKRREYIITLECSEEFRRLNFQPVDYTDQKGEKRRQYIITRDGFTFLAMGFTDANFVVSELTNTILCSNFNKPIFFKV